MLKDVFSPWNLYGLNGGLSIVSDNGVPDRQTSLVLYPCHRDEKFRYWRHNRTIVATSDCQILLGESHHSCLCAFPKHTSAPRPASTVSQYAFSVSKRGREGRCKGSRDIHLARGQLHCLSIHYLATIILPHSRHSLPHTTDYKLTTLVYHARF